MKNYDAESETEIKTLDFQLQKLEQIETEMVNMSKSTDKKTSKHNRKTKTIDSSLPHQKHSISKQDHYGVAHHLSNIHKTPPTFRN